MPETPDVIENDVVTARGFSTAYQVQLLGGPCFNLGGIAVFEDAPTKAKLLLAFLAENAGTKFERAQLAGRIWAEVPNAAALNNLRQALFKLRKLAPGFVDASLDVQTASIGWVWPPPPGSGIDTSTLEMLTRGTASGADPNAVETFLLQVRGAFLGLLTVADMHGMDDWFRTTQASVQDRLARLFERECAQRNAQAQPERCLALARQWLTVEPYSEAAHSYIMKSLIDLERRHEALTHFAGLRDDFRQELGLEPGDTLVKLEARAKSQEFSRLNVSPLPTTMSPCIGRTREIVALQNQFGLFGGQMHAAGAAQASHRLITLCGLGGMGKTRIALEFARQMRASCDTVFVPLADVNDRAGLVSEIGRAIGMDTDSPVHAASLMQQLATRNLMLVLDNFEHIAGEAPLLQDMLARAPDLRILVTSREPLRLDGEQLLRVGGLALDGDPHAQVAPAMTLFAQCARRSNAGFEINDHNSRAVYRICQLVGGMPLALEIAGAWAGVMPPSQIEQELERDLALLGALPGDSTVRSGELLTALEWSWRRLQELDREAMRRLTLFQGGFTPEAATALGVSFRALATLVSRALLAYDPEVLPGGRYSLHPLLKQYVAQKTGLESDPSFEATGLAHSRFFLADATGQFVSNDGLFSQRNLPHLHRELPNILHAFAWASKYGDPELVAAGAYVVFWVGYIAGNALASEDALRRALVELESRQTLAPGALYIVRLRHMQAMFTCAQYRDGASKARQLCQHPHFGHLPRVAQLDAHIYCGLLHMRSSQLAEAETCLYRSRAFITALENDAAQPLTLAERMQLGFSSWLVPLGLAMIALIRSDLGNAQTLCEEALQTARLAGQRLGEARCMALATQVLIEAGNLDRAEAIAKQAQANYARLGATSGGVFNLISLGRIARERGQTERAARFLQDALDAAQRIAVPNAVGQALLALGALDRTCGRSEPAGLKLARALDTFLAEGQHKDACDVLIELSLLHSDVGQGALALDAARRAHGLAGKLSNDLGIAHAEFALGRAHDALGARADAANHLRAAQAAFLRLKVPHYANEAAVALAGDAGSVAGANPLCLPSTY